MQLGSGRHDGNVVEGRITQRFPVNYVDLPPMIPVPMLSPLPASLAFATPAARKVDERKPFDDSVWIVVQQADLHAPADIEQPGL